MGTLSKAERAAERAAAAADEEARARERAAAAAAEARKADERADRLRAVLREAAIESDGDDGTSESADEADQKESAPNAFAQLSEGEQGSSDAADSDSDAARAPAAAPAAAVVSAAASARECNSKSKKETADKRKAKRSGAAGQSKQASGNSSTKDASGANTRSGGPPLRPLAWSKMTIAAVLAGTKLEPEAGTTLGWIKGYIAAVWFGTTAERAAAGIAPWEPADECGGSPTSETIAASVPLGEKALRDPDTIRPWNTGGVFKGKFETAIGHRGADAKLAQALAAAVADGDILPPQRARYRASEAASVAADEAKKGGIAAVGKTNGEAGKGTKLSEEERAALRRQYKAQLEERAAQREGFAP